MSEDKQGGAILGATERDGEKLWAVAGAFVATDEHGRKVWCVSARTCAEIERERNRLKASAPSSCAARDAALEEAAERCDSFARSAANVAEEALKAGEFTRRSGATLQGLAAQSCAGFIRDMKGAPLPESGQINAAGQEGNVMAGRLRLDTGTPAEGRHSTDTESSPAPAAPSTPQPEAPTPRTPQWYHCPYCGGALDTGNECTKCGADWLKTIEARELPAAAANPLPSESGGTQPAGMGEAATSAQQPGASALSASAESTKWEEEARRYAQNADFWREKYESARSSSTTSEAASLAEQWKGRADDCGKLARAILGEKT